MGVVLIAMLMLPSRVFAQVSMPGMQMPGMTMAPAGPLGLSMARDGSGTSWQPDATPMSAGMFAIGTSTFMVHGSAFLEETHVGGSRRAQQLGSINWIMASAERATSRNAFTFRAMTSLEPLTVGRCGYPDLLQSGETCNGASLHDRQHPHDLFMEISADYRHALSSTVALDLYAAPAGEPALGPVAFSHRPSAAPNPIAPISHHWLDSTHVSFGVVTGGLFGRRWKAEASAFNGREPDDRRYGVDLAPLDSYSGRFWWLPAARWAFQVSAGRLTACELHADGSRSDVTRVTASATYHRLVRDRLWASTAAWGRNREDGQTSPAFLFETSLDTSARDVWYGRFELVGKTPEELALTTPSTGVLDVAKTQVGYTRWLTTTRGVKVGIGGSAAVSRVPAAAAAAYGSRVPGEVAVYVNVRPR